MRKQTKSPMEAFTIKNFQKMFPDDNACLEYLRREWFPEIITCAGCKREARFYRITTRKVYGCEHCGYQISPTAGTIFHKSPTPLTTWFYVIYQMSKSLNGISAKQIQRETGVTYKCAWRMCTQVRKMLDEGNDPLSGEVEMDESYYGGEEKNKHANKRTANNQGRSIKTKIPVFGMIERGGKLSANVVDNVQSETLLPIVLANVAEGAQVYTDEFNAYNLLQRSGYKHAVIPHGQRIYVMDRAHTNTIEGFWSLSKNGIRGTYHAVSDKYLPNYIDEYSFRYNHRNDITPMFLTFLSRVRTSGKSVS